MKSIMFWITKVLGFVFFVGVIAYTAFLTFLLAAMLLPDNIVGQVMTIILFDVAAVVWFMVFMFSASGIAQWGISLIGWLVGLLGAVLMAGGEIILSQKLVAFKDPERLGWIIVIATVAACLIHALLSYLYHLTDPERSQSISQAVQIARMKQRAFDNASAEADRRIDELTEPLTRSMLEQVESSIQAATLWYLRDDNPKAPPTKAIPAKTNQENPTAGSLGALTKAFRSNGNGAARVYESDSEDFLSDQTKGGGI